MTSIKQIVKDITYLEILKMNGVPDYEINEIALKIVKTYDWLW